MRNHQLMFRGIWPILFFALIIPTAVLFAGASPTGPNYEVTDQGLQTDDAEEPSIAVLGNTVYAVWQDERDDGPQDTNGAVYFSKSTDGGQTWGDDVRVTIPSYDKWADDPKIAVQPDGTIWIIWFQLYRNNSNKVNDIRLAFSTDDGATFSNESILVNGFDDDETLWRPDIAADENNLYVLYRYYSCASPCNSSSQEGYTIALTAIDSGEAERTTTIVSDSLYTGRFTGGLLDNGPKVELALGDGLLCAAWEDSRSQEAIYGACSQDQGQTFGSDFQISPSRAVNPSLALGNDGTLFATYSLENDSQNNIWLTMSEDQGQSWSTPKQITNQTTLDVEYWDLAVDSTGQLLLSWVVESGSFSSDLHLSTSIDQGANWATLLIEDGQGQFPASSDQTHPAIVTNNVAGESYAYVAWSDDRNSNDQIWFARFLLDGDPPAAPQNLTADSAAGAIQLTWQAVGNGSDVIGYHVYRATTAGGPFARINPLVVESTSYVDPELSAGSRFYYQVAAIDDVGNVGPRSNTADATAGQNANGSTYGTIAYQSGDDVRLRDLASSQETTIA
ncbi:MAG: exo-alpha-sialidase, partial [Chloroflexota bacterium]